MIPMVEPGPTIIRALLAPRFETRAERFVVGREHGGGEKRGVDRPRLADGKRTHWNARGHLDDGEQAIHALQRLGFDGHSKNGKRGHRSGHARKVRRAPRTCDDDPEPALLGGMGIVVEPLGGAVRGDDLRLVGDAKRFQRFSCMAHRLPVGLRPHDDAD